MTLAAPACADTYTQSDVLSVEQSIVGHVEYTLARSRYKFDDQEAYQATSLSLRDRLIESWNDTQQYFKCAYFKPTLRAASTAAHAEQLVEGSAGYGAGNGSCYLSPARRGSSASLPQA